MLGLTRLLDARVYVALGRGLWDFTAKDVYDYVESLQEDRHNKVGSAVQARLLSRLLGVRAVPEARARREGLALPVLLICFSA